MKTRINTGDFVTNLTEEQFNYIMELQPEPYRKYSYIKGQTDTLVFTGKYIDYPAFGDTLCKKFEFEEFLTLVKQAL